MAQTSVLRERNSVLVIAGDKRRSPASDEAQQEQPPNAGEVAEENGTQQIRSFLMALGMVCTFGAMIFRSLYLWQQCSSERGRTTSSLRLTIQVSVLLGIEACLLAMAVLLALTVPRLIVTWTTALVFDFMFRHLATIFGTALSKTESETVVYATSNDRLRRNGMRIAKEMLGMNAAGALVVALCFIAILYLRTYLRYL